MLYSRKHINTLYQFKQIQRITEMDFDQVLSQLLMGDHIVIDPFCTIQLTQNFIYFLTEIKILYGMFMDILEFTDR